MAKGYGTDYFYREETQDAFDKKIVSLFVQWVDTHPLLDSVDPEDFEDFDPNTADRNSLVFGVYEAFEAGFKFGREIQPKQ